MEARFVFPPARTTQWLAVFLGGLLFGHLIVVAGHFWLQRPLGALTELFDMDREANLPALFNVLLFFIAGVLFLVLAAKAEGATKRAERVLGVIMLFLGFDEGAQVHEKFMLVTLRLLNDGTMGDGNMGWFYYAWIIPYGILALLLAVWLVPWFLRLEPRMRNGLILSGVIFVTGAVVMEAASGRVAEALDQTARPAEELGWLPCFAYTAGQCHLYADASYVLLYTIEEICEMAGLILCIHTLLATLQRRGIGLRIAFG